MFRSSNPTLNDDVFVPALPNEATMTLDGVIKKTLILLVLLDLAATFSYQMGGSLLSMAGPIFKFGWIIPTGIAALISFKPTTSPYLAPVYSVIKGLYLGILSLMFNSVFPGIVLQALLLTGAIFAALLGAYSFRIIKPSENFKLGVFAATAGVMLFYLIAWGLSFFGVQIPFLHSNGWVGIGFSAFVVVLAAVNLVLDFDFIETGVETGAPKHMEWYAGFGLMVTLVWLYVELLRLLSKLRSRD